jgi:hypothetical protein
MVENRRRGVCGKEVRFVHGRFGSEVARAFRRLGYGGEL